MGDFYQNGIITTLHNLSRPPGGGTGERSCWHFPGSGPWG